MKKLSILILISLLFNFSYSQESDPLITWEGLIKQKEKTDKEISDQKKNKSYKTWAKRAEIYVNIHTFVTSGLYYGMPADGEGFNTIKILYKEPGKKFQEEEFEVWEYNRMKLYINKEGLLEKWQQTEFIDEKAIHKSSDAYLNAVSLDEKGKFKEKTTSKDLLSLIKKNTINAGILKYQEKKFENAYELMNYGYKLCKLPKNPNDTFYTKEQIGYFLGIISLHHKKYDEAISLFEESIKDKYNPGMSYHYIAECLAKTEDSTAYISKVKEGFELYPDEEQLIIDLINYYLERNQTEAAVEYIDVAINKNPKNPSYYSAKATVYDNKSDAHLKEYKEYMEQAYEHKKAAFRDRNNSKKLKVAEGKRDEALKKALAEVDIIEDYLNKAEELYNKTLEINPKFYNAAYNLGRIYLKRNERNALHADYLLKIYITRDFKKSAIFEDLAKEQLNISAKKFELAHEILPKDRDVLDVLKRLYFRLRDKTNQDRINKIIEKLGASEEKTIE